LREACGPAAALAFLADRVNPSSPLAARETQEAASVTGFAVETYWVDSPEQIDPALRRMQADGKAGFILAPGAMFFTNRSAIAKMARDLRLGSISPRKEYADAGCLLAYGAPIVENYRQAATYVDRVLKGVKPADMPLDEPTKFDVVVNRTTADAIGLRLPATLLSKATTLI
jgi:putative ABC transport system substrate-binding protein